MEDTEPEVAVKAAEEAPLATVTEAGIESRAVLSEIATARPPEVAVWEIVTVQVAEELELREVGEQARELRVGVGGGAVTEMDPPVAVIVTALPVPETPSSLLIAMSAVDALAESVNWADATTPFGITF